MRIQEFLIQFGIIVVIWFAVAFPAGRAVRWLLEEATGGLRLRDNNKGISTEQEGADVTPKEEPEPRELWLLPEGTGPMWLGRMERTLFFVFLAANQPFAIVGYLAFKVAAKWDAWAHIIRLPEMNKNESLDLRTSEFDLRHRFSSWILLKFLIGTIANLLFAIAGHQISQLVIEQFGSATAPYGHWPLS